MDFKTGLLVLLSLLLSLSVGYLVYIYKSPAKRYFRYILALLRAISLFGIFLLLINPGLNIRAYENQKPKAILLFDNSSSMLKGGKKDDLEKVRFQLINNKDFNTKYDLQVYSFGEEISMKDSLLFDKQFTNIYDPIQKLNKTYEKDAGLFILVTDGNQNQGRNFEQIRSLKQVFPVVVGDTTNKRDIKITRVNSNKYSYVNHTFPIEVFLNYQGSGKVDTGIEIWEKNKLLLREKLTLDEGNAFKKLEFKLSAETIGNHFYTVKIGSLEKEENLVNNTFNFSVRVLEDKASILLLYDHMHPDIGFWQRMAGQDNRRKIEVKQISEFNQQLAGYSFVILMNPNPKFERIMLLLEEKSINYLVQTGDMTDWIFLNRVQPYLESSNTKNTEQALIKQNADFMLFNTSPLELDNFPPLANLKEGIRSKQKSQVLWVTATDVGQPVFLFFEHGKGRKVFLLGENLFRWQLYDQHKNGSNQQIKNYFNSMLQFLSIEKNRNQLDISYKPIYWGNEEIILSAAIYDANYNLDPNQTLFLTLMEAGKTVGNKIPMALNNNTYEIKLSDLAPTVYDFKVEVDKMDIHGQGSFNVLDFSMEDQEISTNLSGLRQLAYNSEAKYYNSSDVNLLINNLVENTDYKTIQKETITKKTMIDLKWLFFIIIVSLSAEWFLRKYKGFL